MGNLRNLSELQAVCVPIQSKTAEMVEARNTEELADRIIAIFALWMFKELGEFFFFFLFLFSQ